MEGTATWFAVMVLILLAVLAVWGSRVTLISIEEGFRPVKDICHCQYRWEKKTRRATRSSALHEEKAPKQVWTCFCLFFRLDPGSESQRGHFIQLCWTLQRLDTIKILEWLQNGGWSPIPCLHYRGQSPCWWYACCGACRLGFISIAVLFDLFIYLLNFLIPRKLISFPRIDTH